MISSGTDPVMLRRTSARAAIKVVRTPSTSANMGESWARPVVDDERDRALAGGSGVNGCVRDALEQNDAKPTAPEVVAEQHAVAGDGVEAPAALAGDDGTVSRDQGDARSRESQPKDRRHDRVPGGAGRERHHGGDGGRDRNHWEQREIAPTRNPQTQGAPPPEHAIAEDQPILELERERVHTARSSAVSP